MNKFEGRIRKLITKTHNFVSYEDLCLMRDYFEERFDEAEKPEDLESRLQELEILSQRRDVENDTCGDARMRELICGSDAVRYKGLYEWMTRLCNAAPNGTWLPELVNYAFPRLIADAKAYFARKKEGVDSESNDSRSSGYTDSKTIKRTIL
jgi:hypothetical protein